MTSVGLTVDVFVAFLVEIAAKVGILLIEKVGGSDGYPIQLGVGCEQRGKLLLHFLVCLKDVIERLGLVAADVKTCREETNIVERVGETLGDMERMSASHRQAANSAV